MFDKEYNFVESIIQSDYFHLEHNSYGIELEKKSTSKRLIYTSITHYCVIALNIEVQFHR